MKIALIYDRVNKFGGAEQVLLALRTAFPQAPLYTAVYNAQTASWAKPFNVKPSFLQHLPFARLHHEFFPMLTPMAFESFNLSDYDVVISVTSAEAKAVITSPKTLHLCYCLTPTRYLWSHRKRYQKDGLMGKALQVFLNRLQQNDLVYAQRPDQYLAISTEVGKRIKRYYNRDSKVIFPPVDTKFYSHPRPKLNFLPQNYFIAVSRLVSYKHLDLAIKAFNRLKLPLVIVGRGKDESRLKAIASKYIIFIPQLSREELSSALQHAQAFILPNHEDFGIAAVEAQSAGIPVIAYNRGGSLDTVTSQAGVFFARLTVDSLVSGVKRFNARAFSKSLLVKNSKRFDQAIFINQIKSYVEDQWQKHQQTFR